MKLRVLGCSGGIGGREQRTTSLLVDHDILIDCGTGVGDLPLDELARIDEAGGCDGQRAGSRVGGRRRSKRWGSRRGNGVRDAPPRCRRQLPTRRRWSWRSRRQMRR